MIKVKLAFIFLVIIFLCLLSFVVYNYGRLDFKTIELNSDIPNTTYFIEHSSKNYIVNKIDPKQRIEVGSKFAVFQYNSKIYLIDSKENTGSMGGYMHSIFNLSEEHLKWYDDPIYIDILHSCEEPLLIGSSLILRGGDECDYYFVHLANILYPRVIDLHEIESKMQSLK